MSPPAVGALYDALHRFEARFRHGTAYPIHKRLHFTREGTRDIYDWIVGRAGVDGHGAVLDAGCGTGFGTIRLAEAGARSVTGYGVSGAEIATARLAAHRAGLADRVRFVRGSFDQLPEGQYDLVVAVESLKHAEDLERSIGSLGRALKPGGRLLVVDDVLVREPHPARAAGLIADWQLTGLYADRQFSSALAGLSNETVDLSKHVRSAGPLSRCLQRSLLSALIPFAGATGSTALKAFRGGVHLEALYALRQMAYIVFDCRRPRASLR